MKFASYLAQFLYEHKRLDLPGIGSFMLDPATTIEIENAKQNRPVQLEGVSFETNSSVKQSPELIEYIAGQTGKIKALAAADLDSHLELARQFLNIGKPFLFEGIGSLVKMQAGGFSFTPGHIVTEKKRELVQKEPAAIPSEESGSDYRSIFYAKKGKANWKKPAMVMLLLAGIVLAIWGGYAMYKKTTAKKATPSSGSDTIPVQLANQPATSDTQQRVVQNVNQTASVTASAGNFKFVIETATRDRALKRYSKLSTIGVKNIQMETSDSLTFKLFFILPASPADTTRILDSLRRNYTPAGVRAYVE